MTTATDALKLLIALPLLTSPLVYLAGRLNRRRSNKPNAAAISRWMSIACLLACFVPLFILNQAYHNSGTVELTVEAIALRFDGISLLMVLVTLFSGLTAALFSAVYMANEAHEEKFYALLLIMLGAIMGMMCTADLFNLWIWFEIMSISSVMLVAFYRDNPGSLEAAAKYLIQSAVGSAFVVLGIGFVFAQVGTLDLAQIQANAGGSTLLIAAGACFLIGFGIKGAFVPLHTWLPDAHSQAPSGISAILSGVVIESGLIALLRALGAIHAASGLWGTILLVIGGLNMLLGNLMALRQTEVKRLLAFSSITNVGYILLGLGAAIASPAASAGAQGSFFHIFNHAAMKGLAFLSAGALLYVLHLAKGDHNPLTLDDLNGASRRYPLVAFTFSAALLALGGLPPFSGFMSKWQIFSGAAAAQDKTILFMVIFAALNSVLSLGYYAPIVNRIYRREPSEAVQNGLKVAPAMAVSLILLLIPMIVLGIMPNLLDGLTAPAAASLMQIFQGF